VQGSASVFRGDGRGGTEVQDICDALCIAHQRRCDVEQSLSVGPAGVTSNLLLAR
jgi:hypothetical protein